MPAYEPEKSARGKAILRLIRDEERLRMACGDMRVTTTLTARGYLILRNPLKREFTDSYEITQKGIDAL